MKNYLYLILLFLYFTSGCAKQNPINFSSSEAFFSSLNEKEVLKKENKRITLGKNSLQNNIEKTKNQIVKNSFLLNFPYYEKQLKAKIGFDEFTMLKIFNEPDLKIRHGKIKNFQFHLKFCHLDLFFLNEDETYKFKHFDIRPSSMSSILNKKKCVKELNSRFILTHDPK